MNNDLIVTILIVVLGAPFFVWVIYDIKNTFKKTINENEDETRDENLRFRNTIKGLFIILFYMIAVISLVKQVFF